MTVNVSNSKWHNTIINSPVTEFTNLSLSWSSALNLHLNKLHLAITSLKLFPHDTYDKV